MLKQDALVIGLCVGLVATAIFVLLHIFKGFDFFKRNPPDLAQAITLILSSAGAVSGFDFGRVALLTDTTQLGIFTKHQAAMVVGAVVLVSSRYFTKHFKITEQTVQANCVKSRSLDRRVFLG